MVLRTCIVLLGFYFIPGDDWERLLAGLLGFIVARLIVLRLTRIAEQAGESVRETGHAP
jgi:F1F0 ATPase subunit 2